MTDTKTMVSALNVIADELQAMEGTIQAQCVRNAATIIEQQQDNIVCLETSNSFLKSELDQLANFNPDWDRLQSLTESHREVCTKLSAYRECLSECNRLSMEDGGLSYEFDNYFKTVVEPLLEGEDGE